MSHFPRGKLNAADEGQLRMAFSVQGNTLVLDFGKPVKWIGFGLNEVRALREAFERYEKQLEAKES